MKLAFHTHAAHQAFLDNEEARSAAETLRDVLGLDEYGIACDDCDADDDDVADEKGERSKHYKRSKGGSLEVRDKK